MGEHGAIPIIRVDRVLDVALIDCGLAGVCLPPKPSGEDEEAVVRRRRRIERKQGLVAWVAGFTSALAIDDRGESLEHVSSNPKLVEHLPCDAPRTLRKSQQQVFRAHEALIARCRLCSGVNDYTPSSWRQGIECECHPSVSRPPGAPGTS